MESDTFKWLGILITMIFIMYIVYSLLTYLRNGNEAFSGSRLNYDIAGYLAARTEYDTFYNSGGADICSRATEPSAQTVLCGAGQLGPSYTYSPPLLIADADADMISQCAAANIQIDKDIQLEYPQFILYTRKPTRTTFELGANYGTKTPFENYLDSIARLTVSNDAFATYKAYININYKLYEYKKIYSPAQANILAIRKQDVRSSTPLQLYVAIGPTQLQYEQLAGEPSADSLRLLLNANSQAALNKSVRESATGRSADSGSVPGTAGAPASASASAVNRQILQLPLQTYIADGWLANKTLFDEMASSTSSTSAKNYANAAGVANSSDNYITTLRKFIELDKRILASGTAGVQLKAPNGKPYKFKVPNAYDPTLQSQSGEYETPADSGTAIDFKCYTLKQEEVDAIAYFSRRNYESADMPNKEIADKIRKNICASYGYYSASETMDVGCNCNGCCIPIAYKAKQSGLGLGGQVQQALDYSSDSLELLKMTDKCVHVAQPFQLKRTGPVFRKTPTCGMETREGFIALPDNYGLMNNAVQLRAERPLFKGQRFFGATGQGSANIL